MSNFTNSRLYNCKNFQLEERAKMHTLNSGRVRSLWGICLFHKAISLERNNRKINKWQNRMVCIAVGGRQNWSDHLSRTLTWRLLVLPNLSKYNSLIIDTEIFGTTLRPDQCVHFLIIVTYLSNYMSHLSGNIQTNLPGNIYRELFQFKTRSLLFGHSVFDAGAASQKPQIWNWFEN